ncbi:MAG: pentapeptide repeat-containing protein [Cyanobacteria bacterium J06627_8]
MKYSLIASVAAIALFSWATPARGENLIQLQQLLSTGRCDGCNLSRAGLVYANLSGASLQQVNLRQANLSQADLSGSDLSGADLTRAVLHAADLSDADLRGADLRGADLRGALVQGANFEGALLDGALIRGAFGLPQTIATPELLFQWGMLEAEQGNYELAIQYFSRSLESNPDSAELYLARGIALFRWGDPDTAYEDARQAEQLFLERGDEVGQQNAAAFAEGIIEVQTRIAEGPDPPPADFLGLVGSLGTMLFQFAARGLLAF